MGAPHPPGNPATAPPLPAPAPIDAVRRPGDGPPESNAETVTVWNAAVDTVVTVGMRIASSRQVVRRLGPLDPVGFVATPILARDALISIRRHPLTA